MTILFLTIEYNYCCGISRSIHTLATELERRGHHIIIGAPGGTMIPDLKVMGIDFIRMPIHPNHKKFFELVTAIHLIKKTVNHRNVDIVHSHHRWAEILAKVALFGSKVPTVATVHALLSGMKRLSFRSDKLLAVSNAVVRMLTNEFAIPKDRIDLVRNIPRTLPQPSAEAVNNMRRILKITSNDFIVSGIGRLHPEKGFDLLLAAMCHLKHLPVRLLLAGKGPEAASLKGFARKHKLKASILDEVNEVELIYSLSDLVVVPSRQESAGLVAIEASMFSKPVIATNVGGLMETIQHDKSGQLIPAESPEQIASAIESLYKDRSKANSLGEALNQWVKENYSATSICEQVEEIYQVLQRRRS